MGDSQASGKERKGELSWIQIHVALGCLEPFETCLRGTLQRFHRRPTASLIILESFLDRVAVFQRVPERNTIKHAQSGPRADREVSRVSGVPK